MSYPDGNVYPPKPAVFMMVEPAYGGYILRGRHGEEVARYATADEALNAAFALAPSGSRIVLARGSYTLYDAVNRSGDVMIEGEYWMGTGIFIPSDFTPTYAITLSDGRITLRSVHIIDYRTGGVSLRLNGVDHGLVEDTRLSGNGGVGLVLENTGSSVIRRSSVFNYGYGIRIYGDGGGENIISEVDVAIEPGYAGIAGIHLYRTTTADTGGLYLANVRVVNAGSLTYGYLFESTNTARTPIYVQGVNVVGDNANQGAGARLVNVTNVSLANVWLTGGYGLQTQNIDTVDIFGGLIYGSQGRDVSFEGDTRDVRLMGLRLTGAGTNIYLDGAGVKENIQAIACRYLGTLTNDEASLAASDIPTLSTSGLTVLVRGDLGSTQTLAIREARSTTPKRNKYIRVGAGGDLQILDDAWSKVLLSLSDPNGTFTPWGNIKSDAGSVTAKVKAGAPTDADFPEVYDGLMAVDSSTNRLYVRVGGVWRYVTLT